MAVSANTVTVSDTAVALNAQGTAAVDLTIKNVGTNPADLGSSTVTLGTGLELEGGATVSIRVDGGDVLFAIAAAAATTELRVLRT